MTWGGRFTDRPSVRPSYRPISKETHLFGKTDADLQKCAKGSRIITPGKTSSMTTISENNYPPGQLAPRLTTSEVRIIPTVDQCSI